MSKMLEKIRKDPRVWAVDDERKTTGDGIWVYLETGYVHPESDCHVVKAETIRALVEEFATVRPCNCQDCTPKKDKPE
jgi:hypothetical protein